MKKTLLTTMIILAICSNAIAYEIIATDKSGHSFKDGAYVGKEALITSVYEVDEQNNFIKEKSVLIEGVKTDMATSATPDWKIVSNKDGNILAVRVQKLTEDFISLHLDGTYFMTQTNYIGELDYPGVNVDFDKITSLWFGTYEKS